MKRAVAIFALALLFSARLPAADARALFQTGSKALDEGRADDALQAFDAAYSAQPAPSLLFWIGEAHRAAGHKAKAVEYYRQYLAKLPDGPKKSEAQAHLAELTPPKPEKRKSRRNRKMALGDVELALPKEKPPAAPPQPEPLLALPQLDLPPANPPTAAPAAAAVQQQPPEVAKPEVAKSAEVSTPPAAPPSVAATPSPSPSMPETKPAAAPHPTTVAQAEWSRSPLTPSRVPPPLVTSPENLYFVSYTARLLALNDTRMLRYATTASLASGGALYTHGVAVGRQSEQFKNAVYVGFGTEWGGGSDTLYRYELSWQFMWTPLGPTRLFSPHLGVRLGGMMVKSQLLTSGSLKPGLVAAAMAGVDLQLGRYFALIVGLGYDANLGPDLGANAGLSGYSLDLGATIRL